MPNMEARASRLLEASNRQSAVKIGNEVIVIAAWGMALGAIPHVDETTTGGLLRFPCSSSGVSTATAS